MRSVAQFLQRFPWVMAILRAGFRLKQARFTAGVVGIVLDEQHRVLLVEHVFHPYAPWGLPGGWVDRNEHPGQAVERELREELGLSVTVGEMVHMAMNLPGHLDFAYVCHARGSIQNLSYELLDYRWCSLDDLPRLQRFHYQAITRLRDMQTAQVSL
jgi:ADP-ribose pyrophosphatase YjhB (NUDIX family)